MLRLLPPQQLPRPNGPAGALLERLLGLAGRMSPKQLATTQAQGRSGQTLRQRHHRSRPCFHGSLSQKSCGEKTLKGMALNPLLTRQSPLFRP